MDPTLKQSQENVEPHKAEAVSVSTYESGNLEIDSLISGLNLTRETIRKIEEIRLRLSEIKAKEQSRLTDRSTEHSREESSQGQLTEEFNKIIAESREPYERILAVINALEENNKRIPADNGFVVISPSDEIITEGCRLTEEYVRAVPNWGGPAYELEDITYKMAELIWPEIESLIGDLSRLFPDQGNMPTTSSAELGLVIDAIKHDIETRQKDDSKPVTAEEYDYLEKLLKLQKKIEIFSRFEENDLFNVSSWTRTIDNRISRFSIWMLNGQMEIVNKLAKKLFDEQQELEAKRTTEDLGTAFSNILPMESLPIPDIEAQLLSITKLVLVAGNRALCRRLEEVVDEFNRVSITGGDRIFYNYPNCSPSNILRGDSEMEMKLIATFSQEAWSIFIQDPVLTSKCLTEAGLSVFPSDINELEKGFPDRILALLESTGDENRKKDIVSTLHYFSDPQSVVANVAAAFRNIDIYQINIFWSKKDAKNGTIVEYLAGLSTSDREAAIKQYPDLEPLFKNIEHGSENADPKILLAESQVKEGLEQTVWQEVMANLHHPVRRNYFLNSLVEIDEEVACQRVTELLSDIRDEEVAKEIADWVIWRITKYHSIKIMEGILSEYDHLTDPVRKIIDVNKDAIVVLAVRIGRGDGLGLNKLAEQRLKEWSGVELAMFDRWLAFVRKHRAAWSDYELSTMVAFAPCLDILETTIAQLIPDGDPTNVRRLFKFAEVCERQGLLEKLYIIAQLIPIELLDNEEMQAAIILNVEKLEDLSPEKQQLFIRFILGISRSPSQELQRIKAELVAEILNSSNPELAYIRIMDVFERNNLPYPGKVFLIFQILHGKELAGMETERIYSPVLQAIKNPLQRLYLLYRDLLKVSILSGNRSLLDYLDNVQDGEVILQKAELEGFTELIDEEKIKLERYLSRMEVLCDSSFHGVKPSKEEVPQDIESRYTQLCYRLGITNPSDRLLEASEVGEEEGLVSSTSHGLIGEKMRELFLKPLGLDSFEDVSRISKEAKSRADTRNREQCASDNGVLPCVAGDGFKGALKDYLDYYLENGILAKEWLGSGSSSDMTPLDTDFSMALAEDIDESSEVRPIIQALDKSLVANYGEIILCVRDRGQFVETNSNQPSSELINQSRHSNGYEKFMCMGRRHQGVRTGLAATEIDGIIIGSTQGSISPEQRSEMYVSIARNGFYIPVYDRVENEIKLVFKPGDYDRIRRVFAGIEQFDGESFPFVAIAETPDLDDETKQALQEEIQHITDEKSEADKSTRVLSSCLETELSSMFEKLGLKIRDKDDMSAWNSGVEIENTGSSGRGTAKSGDSDFDFAVRLDDRDYVQREEIKKQILTLCSNPEGTQSEGDIKLGFSSSDQLRKYDQLRIQNMRFLGGKPISEILGVQEDVSIDFDICLTSKSEENLFSSHQAVMERIESIENQFGTDAGDEVRSSIVLAKKILADGEAYKKFEHGGWGGIGVENWILYFDGNIIEAFRSFMRAAIPNKDGVLTNFSEFQKQYPLIDPGLNMRDKKRDDFSKRLTPAGYNKMVTSVGKWLNERGIEY